jgi:biotin carboxylase
MGPVGVDDRWLLVLGAGPGQLGVLETARALGLRTAVCDRDPRAPGFALADRRCIVGTDDEPAIERLAAALPLGGVIAPGSDRPVAVAARIAEKLGLPHPLSAATALVATSRLRQREALEGGGVPQPRWQPVQSARDLELALPVVLKVVDRGGRTRVSVVRRAARAAAALDAARALSRSGPVLAEELVAGPELAVTGFSVGGVYVPVAVTERLCAEVGTFGVATAQLWPAPHAAAAIEVARRAVAAIGVDDGPTTTLLRVSAGGPEVIEVAARLGGGHEAELVELVTGVPLNELAIGAAVGRPLAPSEVEPAFDPRVGGAALRFLTAPSGTLEAVEVPQGQKGVVLTRVYCGPGHVFSPLRRASDRAGAVLAVGASRREALARAEAAAEDIRFLTAARLEEGVALADVRTAFD